MDLIYAFRLPVPVDDAWTTLSDLARVAECLPGASVESVTDEVATGELTVKVGPVAVRYSGAVSVQSQDAAAGVAVLRAKGTETRGDGDAAATITVRLTADGPGATLVRVTAAVEVSGRIARFRRGVLSDVGERMTEQLAACLGGELAMDVTVAVLLGTDVDDDADDGVPEEDAVDDAADDMSDEGTGDDAEPVAPVIPPPPGAPVEVEMVETELGDPFEAVEADDTGLDPEPPAAVEAPLVPGDEPTAPSAGTANVARPVSPAAAAAPVPSAASTAKKVGPVIAAVALLWLLKKLLSRSKG